MLTPDESLRHPHLPKRVRSEGKASDSNTLGSQLLQIRAEAGPSWPLGAEAAFPTWGPDVNVAMETQLPLQEAAAAAAPPPPSRLGRLSRAEASRKSGLRSTGFSSAGSTVLQGVRVPDQTPCLSRASDMAAFLHWLLRLKDGKSLN